MNTPLGGTLVDRVAAPQQKKKALALQLSSLTVSDQKAVELWNIATGAYSPLTGFLGKKDFLSVLARCKLANDVFWPIPVILDVDAHEKNAIAGQDKIFIENVAGEKIATMDVSEIYSFPKMLFIKKVFGTDAKDHPGVARTEMSKPYLLAGNITWIADKAPAAFKPSHTPAQVRKMFQKKHWRRIVAFHTRNVPHRGHEHVQREALKKVDGLLVHPLVGSKKAGDFRNEVVAKAYVYFTAHILPRGKAILSFLPYSAYYAGPREALLTAVIRKNFGCTHFIVGRDHTGVGDFYKREDYARLFKKYGEVMGIEIFHFGKAFYCVKCKDTAFEETCPHEEKYRIHSSGTLLRKILIAGKTPPKEMLHPELSRILLKQKDLFV